MKVNLEYALLQAFYWMLYCIGFGYVTFYLKSFNYTAGEIGLVTAVFGLLAALIQTKVGNIADKSTKWNWKRLLVLLGLLTLALVILMGFLSQKLVTGILFGCFLITISAMMPLINAACFYYQNRGISMDFGKARGFGSLSYALISFILGKLTASFGTLPVVLLGTVDTVLLLAIVFSLKELPASAQESRTRRDQKTASKQNFFNKYPAFMLMLAGLALLLTFHNALCTYMLQIVESVGGDSSNLGTALSIAAITEIPVMFGFSWIIRKTKAENLLIVSGAGYILRCVLLLIASNVVMVYAAQLLQIVTYALYASASVYYTNDVMEESDKVTGQALMSGVATVGSVIGNLIGGWAIEASGVSMMLKIMLAVTVIGAILTLTSKRKILVKKVKDSEACLNS